MLCNRNKGVPGNGKGRSRAALSRGEFESVVILETEVSDELLAFEVTQRVLQLHGLDEQIVLGIQARLRHRGFQIKTEPLLYANAAQLFAALRQVEEQDQIEHDRRRQDGVAAKEIYLELHRVTEPAEDVDVVPALFVVPTRRVVIDAHLVEDVLVQIGIKLRLKNMFQDAELRFFFRLEGLGVIQHFAVAIAQDVR